ncbi:MAG: hypothetical protein ABH834_03565 [Candidatus Altiarchaeota archaeon]
MVPIENENNQRCRWRVGDKCGNDQVGAGIIVNDSLQSRWFCSGCNHFLE